MRKVILLFILLTILIGCSSKLKNVKIEKKDGITYIHNPDIRFSEITLESELVIGLNEDDHVFGSIGFVIENSEGEIFVTGSSYDEISVFTYDGKYKKAIGSKGVGPGEFNDPRKIAFFKNGDMIISDTRNYRYQVLDKNGNFLYSNKEKRNVPMEVIVDNKDRIITSPSMFGCAIEKDSPLITLYDRKFNFIESIDKMEPRDILSCIIPGSYYQIANDAEDNVIVTSLVDNWIRIYKDNKLTMQIDRELPYKKKPIKSGVRKNIHYVDYQPFSKAVSVDNNNNIYVLRNADAKYSKNVEKNKKQYFNSVLEIFDHDGILMKKIPLYGIKPTILFIGKDNKIYLNDREELTIIRYKAIL